MQRLCASRWPDSPMHALDLFERARRTYLVADQIDDGVGARAAPLGLVRHRDRRTHKLDRRKANLGVAVAQHGQASACEGSGVEDEALVELLAAAEDGEHPARLDLDLGVRVAKLALQEQDDVVEVPAECVSRNGLGGLVDWWAAKDGGVDPKRNTYGWMSVLEPLMRMEVTVADSILSTSKRISSEGSTTVWIDEPGANSALS